MEIRYKGVDHGLNMVLHELYTHGIKEDSRNGPVVRFPEPVVLVNEQPANRVSMNPYRDANPFFHFMESLWMLAGMNEVAPMEFYNSNIAQYSDDKTHLRGTAYGWKWRSVFGYDQVELAIERLKTNPEDRRIVMTMWDPTAEWRHPESKDLSCNLQVIFSTRPSNFGGTRILDMTVTNRSNDIIYGCLGSNVFHFSFLMEYVAYHANLNLGNYYQFSTNLHAYLDNPVFKSVRDNKYIPPGPFPMYRNPLSDSGMTRDPTVIRHFILTGEAGDDSYLRNVGVPIYEAYRSYKLGKRLPALRLLDKVNFSKQILEGCGDNDLRDACQAWLIRRLLPKESPGKKQTITIVEADRPE